MLDTMGPPPIPDNNSVTSRSRIPQRWSTSSSSSVGPSTSSSASAQKSASRVSMDSVMPKSQTTFGSALRSAGLRTSTATRSNANPLGLSSSRPAPQTPTSRLEYGNTAPSTPTAGEDFASKVIRSSMSSAGFGNNAFSVSSSTQGSRIPTANVRSEEALKRHQDRMERRRGDVVPPK
jgi:hypothetical protein